MTATELREGAAALADATPEPTPSLAVALVKALADLTMIEPVRAAKVEMKAGGSYTYKYADIGDVVKLTRPVLAQQGIVALTPVHAHGDGLACTVILVHSSGESMRLGPFPFPHGRDAQATGSMVTYHRRYALVAALGMATGEDDDGASAHVRQPEFTWDAKAVQFALLELCEGDKDQAREIWQAMDGDSLTEFDASTAKDLWDGYCGRPFGEESQ